MELIVILIDANNWNTKTVIFNSASSCVGTSGVDCFNYNWGFGSINWLLPPPRLVMKTVNHLRLSKGIGILVTPEWKNSPFYPFLASSQNNKFLVKRLVFNGKNVFKLGSDKSSYFGPDFKGNVSVWYFNFNNCLY